MPNKHQPNPRRPVERPIASPMALRLAAGMVAAGFTAAFIGSFFETKIGAVDLETAQAKRMIVITENAEGGLSILNAGDETEVVALNAAESSYLQNIVRGFRYNRRRFGIDDLKPYEVLDFGPDHYAMRDPGTETVFNFRVAGQIKMAHLDEVFRQ